MTAQKSFLWSTYIGSLTKRTGIYIFPFLSLHLLPSQLVQVTISWISNHFRCQFHRESFIRNRCNGICLSFNFELFSIVLLWTFAEASELLRTVLIAQLSGAFDGFTFRHFQSDPLHIPPSVAKHKHTNFCIHLGARLCVLLLSQPLLTMQNWKPDFCRLIQRNPKVGHRWIS